MNTLPTVPLTNLGGTLSGQITPVGGDGMEPTLSARGYAIVQPADRWSGYGVYALLCRGDVTFRRCDLLLPGKEIRLSLDNDAYPPDTDTTLSRAEFEDMVLGKVVGAINPIDAS